MESFSVPRVSFGTGPGLAMAPGTDPSPGLQAFLISWWTGVLLGMESQMTPRQGSLMLLCVLRQKGNKPCFANMNKLIGSGLLSSSGSCFDLLAQLPSAFLFIQTAFKLMRQLLLRLVLWCLLTSHLQPICVVACLMLHFCLSVSCLVPVLFAVLCSCLWVSCNIYLHCLLLCTAFADACISVLFAVIAPCLLSKLHVVDEQKLTCSASQNCLPMLILDSC